MPFCELIVLCKSRSVRKLNGRDRLQTCLDFWPVGLQERRQRQAFAKGSQVFVGGEAGTIGGYFAQDATRLAEVDRTKVEAINYRCDICSDLGQTLSPGAMLFVVRGAEGYMMYTANRGPAKGQIWTNFNVDFCARPARTYLEYDHLVLTGRSIPSGPPEAQHAGQNVLGAFQLFDSEMCTIKPANRHFGRDGTLFPGYACQPALVIQECEPLAFRISEGQNRSPIFARLYAIVYDTK